MDSIILQGATNTAKLDKHLAKLELQAATNTSAIQMEALRNKCEVVDKIEECCCELKQKIDGSDNARLRDALNEATTRNALLEVRRGRD